MSGPYIVRLTGPSGEHRYWIGIARREVSDIRRAHTYATHTAASNRAYKLREQYGRARIQTEVAVIDLSA